jgi:predicted O-methyltransferase YrrM
VISAFASTGAHDIAKEAMRFKRNFDGIWTACFPAIVGIPPVTLEELVGSRSTCEIVIREVMMDSRAGTAWNLVALAFLARLYRPHRIFEFGTGYGRSSLNLAANTPADTTIFTLDLPSHTNTGFIFRDQSESSKITQLLGDSLTFEFETYLGTCDFVFVDGGHDYRTVIHDSGVALRLIGEKGCIVWDDLSHSWPGVWRALRKLSRRLRIRRIAGTSLALYQHSQPQ